ncbi:MAG TPA: threonine ammonia-lyase [Ktedonobacterales bacterium]|nr:threonine ammonia-lyase [Ktedonobacterales bacterium]
MTTEATAPTSLPVPGAADAAAPAASSDALEAPEEPATTHTSVRPARGVNGRAAKAAKGALPVSIADIWRAQDVLRKSIARTPMIHSRTFSAMTSANVYLKAEMLQRAGSFKIRGATYKMSRLSAAQRQHGVITASAGNHAQGVAIAARDAGVACTIFMPRFAPLAKVTATRAYGAEVVLHGDTYDDAYARCMEMQRETGATYISAFDDVDVIAGQGTLALEMLNEQPDADTLIVPIGGGGLISGIAIAAKSLKPDIRIIGVQASGSGSCRASLDVGEVVTLPAISTIADGIAVKRPGDITFPIIKELVDDILLIDDEQIIRAVLLLLERCKFLVEGAGAISVAALLSGLIDVKGHTVICPLSGGNIDINLVSRFIQHGLSAAGRFLAIHTLLADRPGELLRLLQVIADQGVNVLEVNHHRLSAQVPIHQVEVILTLETRDRAHCDQLLRVLQEQGYQVVESQACF